MCVCVCVCVCVYVYVFRKIILVQSTIEILLSNPPQIGIA